MTEQVLNRTLEMSNTSKFTRVFKRTNSDTLLFIFEAHRYLKVNGFTDEGIKFARIYNTLDVDIKEAVMLEYDTADMFSEQAWQWAGNNDDNDNDNNDNQSVQLQVQNVFDYLIATYPPPPLMVEFIKRLKSDIQRRNEDATQVYKRYSVKLHKMNVAINVCANRVEGVFQQRYERSI